MASLWRSYATPHRISRCRTSWWAATRPEEHVPDPSRQNHSRRTMPMLRFSPPALFPIPRHTLPTAEYCRQNPKVVPQIHHRVHFVDHVRADLTYTTTRSIFWGANYVRLSSSRITRHWRGRWSRFRIG